YREYALDGFELDVVDYLVKPVSFERFFKAVNKAWEQFSHKHQNTHEQKASSENEYFFIKSDGKFIKIYFEEILFVEGLKDYVFIHTAQHRYITLISLKNVEDQLPPVQFMRVQRSFIVALNKIDEIEGNILKIQGKEVPLSKNLRDSLYQRLIEGKLWKR
ncbi:MAG: response regulator transcription factor, partial [Bacteroidia bacterium]|nr:response regulator transcription factor [Bacteroidia bacterium]